MFKHHVFISYAHLDNKKPTDEDDGWVTRFKRTFQVFLDEELEYKSRIWHDPTIQCNENFRNAIHNACRDTTLFFSILTPNYAKSEWCQKEVNEFIQHAELSHGLAVDDKQRIFIIKKRHVDRNIIERLFPTPFHSCTGYSFYVQEDRGRMQLDTLYGGRYKDQYLYLMRVLAIDAASLIKKIEDYLAEQKSVDHLEPSQGFNLSLHEANSSYFTVSKNSVVFLASCGPDQIDNRRKIELDLKSHGYRVLPERNLPSEDEVRHCQSVEALLDQAHCSLHLMGSIDSDVTTGLSPLSQANIQLRMASKRHGLFRLIWLQNTTMHINQNASGFFDGLHPQEEFGTRYDILSGSFEELRTELHARLDQIEQETANSVDTTCSGQAEVADATAPMLYLICTRDDCEATEQLSNWLIQQGWFVMLSTFSGNSATIRNKHKSLLLTCQAVLIFYGAGDEAWHRSVVNDLSSAPAYRGGIHLPLLTYVACPSSKTKDDYVNAGNHSLVDGRQGFRPELLHPFLQKLNIEAARP